MGIGSPVATFNDSGGGSEETSSRRQGCPSTSAPAKTFCGKLSVTLRCDAGDGVDKMACLGAPTGLSPPWRAATPHAVGDAPNGGGTENSMDREAACCRPGVNPMAGAGQGGGKDKSGLGLKAGDGKAAQCCKAKVPGGNDNADGSSLS